MKDPTSRLLDFLIVERIILYAWVLLSYSLTSASCKEGVALNRGGGDTVQRVDYWASTWLTIEYKI